MAIGGPTAFGKGDYVDSVFEDVMPVSSRPAPRPQEGETALIMVLDRSSSMRDFADYDSLAGWISSVWLSRRHSWR